MREFGLLDAGDPRWAGSLPAATHDIYHLPGYAAIDAAEAGGTAAAFWYRENGAQFLLPLVLRDIPGAALRDAISPYGYSPPVATASAAPPFWARALEALVGVLAEAGIVTLFVRLHPLIAVPVSVLSRYGAVVTHGNTVSIDTAATPEERWHEMRKDHRRRIRNALEAPMEIRFDDWSILEDWVELYSRSMARLGAEPRYLFSHDYFERLRRDLPENVHLAVALDEAELVGGHLFFVANGIVNAHVSARIDAPAINPDRLIEYRIGEWAHQQGARIYHLGGGFAAKNDHIFEFKAGFSNRRHEFQSWRVVADAAAYRQLNGAAAASPDGFFPAYRGPAPAGGPDRQVS